MTGLEEDIRVALDTSILATAEGLGGDARKTAAHQLLGQLATHSTIVPAHALCELAFVLVNTIGRSPASARDAVVSWQEAFPVIGTSTDIMIAAADLMSAKGLSIWEAIIVSSALDARCRILLSQNFGEGFTWDTITVVNPFAEPRHPLLLLALNRPER